MRKKNLSPGTTYSFRVRVRDKIDWQPFSPPAQLQVRGARRDGEVEVDGSKQCGLRRLLMSEATSTMSIPSCSSDAGRGHEAGRGAEGDVTGGRLAGCGVGGGAGGGEVSELLLK